MDVGEWIMNGSIDQVVGIHHFHAHELLLPELQRVVVDAGLLLLEVVVVGLPVEVQVVVVEVVTLSLVPSVLNPHLVFLDHPQDGACEESLI